MSSNPFSAYLETKVLSASPLQLIHLAYEGAIQAVADARAHLQAGRIYERAEALTKAQRILSELRTALDFQRGGELSKRLSGLYGYMLSRLNEANFKQIEEPMIDVQKLLETLDEAWKELAATETPAASVAAGAGSPWMTADTPAYRRAEFTL